MKRVLVLILLFSSQGIISWAADPAASQEGTIVRMRLVTCPGPQHRFMMALSGSARVGPQDPCPEYTLLTDKIAYIIIGRASSQLVPLAETTQFRFQNRELLIRLGDSNHESHFMIKEMMIRSEWERQQERRDAELRAIVDRDEGEDSQTKMK